jgi:hypothetical protein
MADLESTVRMEFDIVCSITATQNLRRGCAACDNGEVRGRTYTDLDDTTFYPTVVTSEGE